MITGSSGTIGSNLLVSFENQNKIWKMIKLNSSGSSSKDEGTAWNYTPVPTLSGKDPTNIGQGKVGFFDPKAGGRQQKSENLGKRTRVKRLSGPKNFAFPHYFASI